MTTINFVSNCQKYTAKQTSNGISDSNATTAFLCRVAKPIQSTKRRQDKTMVTKGMQAQVPLYPYP